MVKRISYIVNPQGLRTDAIKRKEERILRQIDQAIASAQDQADEALDQSEKIIDSLGSVSDSSDTCKLQDKLNAYCDACEHKTVANRYAEYLSRLKAKLSEEIDVTVNPTHVIVDSK